MTIGKIISKTAKTLAFVALAVVLLVVGCVMAVYSPWLQDSLRQRLVEHFNGETGLMLRLDEFRLRFPATLDIKGLAVATEGDTIVAAQQLSAKVDVMQLLGGEVKASKILLEKGRFTIGAPDSVLYMKIMADTIDLHPVAVGLKDMKIELDDGLLAGMRFYMRSLPSIDSLDVEIRQGTIRQGIVDLTKQEVKIKSFMGRRLDAVYIAPDSATIAATPIPAPTDSAAAPWTIEIDSINFRDSYALYTTQGVVAQPGLDFAYIEVDSLNLAVSHFYNQATTLRLPLTLSGTERCGVTLSADGVFSLDSTAMHLDRLTVGTATTSLGVDMTMGMGDMTTDPNLPIKLQANGGVGVADLKLMFPAFLPYLSGLKSTDRIGIEADVDGTMAYLAINRFAIAMNGCLTASASGYAENLTSPDMLGGDIHIHGRVVDINKMLKGLSAGNKPSDIHIPSMKIDGRVAMHRGLAKADMTVTTGAGRVALDGKMNIRREDYDAKVTMTDLPLSAFLPAYGIGDITATLTAAGHGFNPFVKSMKTDVQLAVNQAEYGGYNYRDITLDARADDGVAVVKLASTNPDTRFDVEATGNLVGDAYKWTLAANADDIDLLAIKLADIQTNVSLALNGNALITPGDSSIKADLILHSLDYTDPAARIELSGVKAFFNTDRSSTNLSVHNRDLVATFDSPVALDTIVTRLGLMSDEIANQFAARSLNVEAIHDALPPFIIDVNAGASNMLNDILSAQKMSFRHLSLAVANDSTFNAKGQLLSLRSGTTRLDTIDIHADQHGQYLGFGASVNNRPGTFDDWAHVNLDGYMAQNEVGLRMRQRNIKNVEGFDVGLKASIDDSIATLNIVPANQTIAYKPWTVNANNFISYNLNSRHLDADLVMTGDRSKVEIITNHDDASSEQEDLTVKLSEINLADWIMINPFAPSIKGDLNADVKIREVDGMLNGVGNVSVDNFYYGKERVASVGLDFDVKTRPGGELYAKSDVFVDGRRTMTLSGNLNDSTATSPFDLDFAMIHFPLTTVNPFLPPRVARLRGMLNGTMHITGSTDEPVFNGYIDFDSTAVRLYMTGMDYEFSNDSIAVVDNKVTFDRFTISGVNENPLLVNGEVDITSLASPKIDLTMKAQNMQLVNSRRASKGADVYGKAFISLDSRVHGDLNLLFVNADLSIVAPTNVTYVLTDAANTITSQSVGDMVRFVNFTDSLAVLEVDSIGTSGMAMILDATLNIENGTTIGVDLSTDGKNRAQIEADGTLNYTMTPLDDEGRMTGRLNINNGYVRYTPPLLSEKNFTFDNSSYISFTGDVLNPTINIKAVDVVKANVTQSGQNSRLVDFDITLGITGTLDRLDVAFDLSTDEDVSVANELQGMTAEQRANQAMNMLLYGIYTGPGTKGDAAISGNALYSFLESQINSWAANNIKGVDLTFGIDQYNTTVDGSSSLTTSYSYQVSKSLFDDRFKIIVGGNYSTDANADENFSQNLINDISFEYFLNRGHTMYVRIFRHTGYESILEGEITQTGVGFAYRRKLNSIGDMFKFLKPRKRHDE